MDKDERDGSGGLKSEIGSPITNPLKHDNDASISWEETIPWLRSLVSDMKIIVKGILTYEDAALAAKCRVDGVWVSNHRGRQPDTCPSSLDALPEIVDALCPSYSGISILDSGVTGGTGVFKFALGADLSFIGRPTLWGLTCRGQDGVELVLKVLEKELRLAMGLSGTRNLGRSPGTFWDT